jgi:hypothetical protein
MLDFPNNPSNGQVFQGLTWDGVKWTNVGAVSQASAFNDVGRNLLHNPLFNVAQRGVGPWTTTGTFTLDRWSITLVTDAVSVTPGGLSDAQRSAIGDEAANTSLMNVFTGNSAAGAYNYIAQSIEGVRRLGGKTVTVSFWAVAGAALRLGLNFYQAFGSGGSPSAGAWIGAGQSVLLSTTWTRYSLTFAIPSTSGKTLGTNSNDCTYLALWYSSGATNNANAGNIGVQSGTVQLWGIQLEIGSVATPLEKPDPQQDLAKCQRFYQVGISGIATGYTNASGYVSSFTYFPVTMRASPTVAYTGTIGADLNLSAMQPPDVIFPGSFRSGAQAIATGVVQAIRNYTASADL